MRIEYKIQHLHAFHLSDLTDNLNELGKEGWELIHIGSADLDRTLPVMRNCVFKRYVIDKE